MQPPRNGRYGDPGTVVYQGTYQGDPQKLAADITGAIRQYVGKLAGGYAQRSVSPPWNPPPTVDRILPFRPDDNGGRLIPPLIPDEVEVQVGFPWTAALTLLAGGVSIPAIIALVVWLLAFIRSGRKEADKPLLLSDEVFQKLLETLEGLSNTHEAKQDKPEKTPTTTG